MTLLSHNMPALPKYFSIGTTLFQLLSFFAGSRRKNLISLQLGTGVGGKRAAVLTEEKLSQQPEPGIELGSRLFSLGGEASSPNPRIYIAISKIRDFFFFQCCAFRRGGNALLIRKELMLPQLFSMQD